MLIASPILIFALIGIASIYPIISVIKYCKNPIYTSNKQISADSILTTSIIVFNLIIVNFALVLLLNVDFSILKDVIMFIAVPITLYVDIFIFSLIRYFIAKSKNFNLIKK